VSLVDCDIALSVSGGATSGEIRDKSIMLLSRIYATPLDAAGRLAL
jgi:hypothetical protein